MLQLLIRKGVPQRLDRRREETFITSPINPWDIAELEDMGLFIVRLIVYTDMTLRMVSAVPLVNERIDTKALVNTLVGRKNFVAYPALKRDDHH